jgi:hypothetical protein
VGEATPGSTELDGVLDGVPDGVGKGSKVPAAIPGAFSEAPPEKLPAEFSGGSDASSAKSAVLPELPAGAKFTVVVQVSPSLPELPELQVAFPLKLTIVLTLQNTLPWPSFSTD